MADKAATLGMMEGLLSEGDMPFSAQGSGVVCQACRVSIDPATGAPLEPVTRDNVDAVRKYMSEAGSNELGGVQLDTATQDLLGG